MDRVIPLLKNEIIFEFSDKALKNYLDLLDSFTKSISDQTSPSKEDLMILDQQYPIALELAERLYKLEAYTFTEFESLFACMEILCNITCHTSPIKDKTRCIEFVAKMFLVIEKKQETVDAKYNPHIQKQTGLLILLDDEEEPQDMFYGYQCNLIRLLGNISYRNKEMQDLMRKMELIPLIMKKSAIDFENPYMQEWCVVAIRNLTEYNEENQEEIKKYRPIDVDPHSKSMAQKMGMDINLQDNERVTVTKL